MFDWLAKLDPNLPHDLWIVGIGAMTNVACALVGCYLVLRCMSLLGDAISHAVLPGLVVAFALSGTVSLVWMFAGALAIGVLTALLADTLHHRAGVSEDASLGVVFTSLFALGVILIKRFGSAVDLDPDCVLNGLLELATFNRVSLAGIAVPRAAVTIGPVLLVNVLFIVLCWKELLVGAFDPALAETMGFRAGWLHYVLMALVALTTVASFEQVGSILVVAMLIVPGAAAHLLCDRLAPMLWVAAGIGAASAVVGHAAAVYWNINTAGAMAVAAGAIYLGCVVFAPRYGLASRGIRNLRTSLRIVAEDLLGMLYRLEELAAERRLTPREARRALGGGWKPAVALRLLEARGYLRRQPDGLCLSAEGRAAARPLVRSHRLWEVYLMEYLSLPADHVHEPAMRMEHYIGPEMQTQLAAQLGGPETDPHGREIPAPAQDRKTQDRKTG